ncbi:hypothetical protein [Aquincola agrisoli]
MIQRDAAFWAAHERRRLEQELSVPQYCAANALALSTYRHRVGGKARGSPSARASTPPVAPSMASRSPGFVAVPMPQVASKEAVEIELQGVTLRLRGPAAERVLEHVIAGVLKRLA